MDYEALSKKYVLHALRRPKSLIFERAQGSRMWDIHGKMYLDTMSGSAGPAMVGHAHPAVAEAVAQQMAKLPSVNLLHDSPPLIEFCARMATIAPTGDDQDFPVYRRRRSGRSGDQVRDSRDRTRRSTFACPARITASRWPPWDWAECQRCASGCRRGVRWPNFRQIPFRRCLPAVARRGAGQLCRCGSRAGSRSRQRQFVPGGGA